MRRICAITRHNTQHVMRMSDSYQTKHSSPCWLRKRKSTDYHPALHETRHEETKASTANTRRNKTGTKDNSTRDEVARARSGRQRPLVADDAVRARRHSPDLVRCTFTRGKFSAKQKTNTSKTKTSTVTLACSYHRARRSTCLRGRAPPRCPT